MRGLSLPNRPRRTIRQRLVLGNIAIGMLLLLAGGIVVWQANRLTDAVDVLQLAGKRATTALEVRQDSTDLIAAISRLLAVEDAAAFETQVAAALDALRQSHADLATLAAEATEDETAYPLLNRVGSSIDSVIGIAETMVRQASAGQWPSVKVRVGVLIRDHQQLASETDELVELAKEIEEAAVVQVASARRAVVLYLALVIGLSVALGAVLTLWTTRSIARPVERLTHGAARLAAGFLDERVAVESADELGQLAVAFNQMAANLNASQAELEHRVEARTAQLRASADVGRAAASILDPDQLVHEVVNLITDRFGFYYAAVFTLDDNGRFAVLREATGEAGRILKERGHRLEVGGQSMVGFATSQRKPRIALDVGADPVRFANPLLPETRSEIALPLVVGEKVFGALDAQSTQAGAFDEASTAVLQSMADQIAVALNNATSYAEAQAALAETEVLYGASRHLASARDLQEIVAAATESVRVPDINRATLHLFERNAAGEIVASVVQANWYSGWGSPPATIGVRYATDEFLIVKLFATTEEPFFLEDALHDERVDPTTLAVLQERNIRAMAVLPLRAGAHRVGVLLLQADNPHHFRESEMRPYVSLAQQMGIAIENLRLSEQTRRALDEVDAINRRLTGEAWSKFSQHAARDGVMWVSSGNVSEKKDWPEVAESLASGRIVVRPGTSPHTLGVAVPILLRGTAIGALHLSVSEGIWTDELASVLETLAGHVAQAAENARLLETAEERAWREHALSESTDKVRRGTDVERILQTAAEELARHLKATRVAVHLGVGGEGKNADGHTGNAQA